MSQTVRRPPHQQQAAFVRRPQFDEIGSRGRQLVILVFVSLLALVVWASTSDATPAQVTPSQVSPSLQVPDSGPVSIREGHYSVESGSSRACEDTRCGTSITERACGACSLYRQTMNSEHLKQVSFHGVLLERGVALRATSSLPEVQNQLFSVAVARNQILQQVHEGGGVELCEPCLANARTFLDVQFAVERIPDGIILSYTSSRDDLVELLQVMLLNGSELPL